MHLQLNFDRAAVVGGPDERHRKKSVQVQMPTRVVERVEELSGYHDQDKSVVFRACLAAGLPVLREHGLGLADRICVGQERERVTLNPTVETHAEVEAAVEALREDPYMNLSTKPAVVRTAYVVAISYGAMLGSSQPSTGAG